MENCSLFTKQCIKNYSSNWQVVHYRYAQYSGGYTDLPKLASSGNLSGELYEVDIDEDSGDIKSRSDNTTKEGWLMKGPEIGKSNRQFQAINFEQTFFLGSERGFVNMGSKSFKRRYCYLRQEVDGTYILEMYKDEKKGEAKMTIVMDFCTDVVKVDALNI